MKYTAEEVRARFKTWTSAQPWFKATVGFGRSGDGYADPCINSRWQGWQASYAERIAADEVVVTDEVVQKFADELDELFAVEDAQEPAFLNDVRRIQTSVWPHPPAQAAQVDKPPRLGGCCCGEPCTLGVVHRTDGPCFHYVEPTAEPVAQGEFDAEARSHARMIHDFPRLSAFFQKHALGSKLPASCFACGHVGERAITHAELADIYVCKTCAEKIAKSPAKSAEPSTQPTTNSPETDSKLVGGAVAQGEAVAFKYPAAVRSVAAFLLEKFEHARCDSRWVSCCTRCAAVALSRWAIESLDSTGTTPPAQPAERGVDGCAARDICAALTELDNVTGDTDDASNHIGCAENALRHALEVLESEWPAIDTAPRDGTVIFASGYDNGDPEKPKHYVEARWQEGMWVDRDVTDDGCIELAHLTKWAPLAATQQADR